ncbi:SPOR domain-containing protein [Olivibacter sp. SDN3]|uniref:SPOR domain-containing protein n=1 Tax=Olivibacter sp. SDN3 TaxID=2764720 RepID=UPI0016517073|nr:SPOR domain-containing protein [Olivibacter sp. SDN3]QNL52137.1 SPOR domain-containing protein [Olivibacter sp. SDN3]
MFNIGQYLYQLLLIHEQIGVPGIGIFRKERIAAGFNKEEGQFVPPVFTYALLSHATVDYILLDFLVKKEQISHEQAREKIDLTVSKLLSEIANKGEVELDKIGFLKQKDNSYVLVPFVSPLPALQPIRDISVQHVPVLPSTTNSAEYSDEELNIPEIIGEQNEENVAPLPHIESQTTSNHWIKWAIAVTVPIIIVLFYFLYFNTSGTPSSTTAVKTKRDTTYQNGDQISASSAIDTNATSANVDTISATNAIKTEEEPIVKKASKTLPYSIVIGSFKTLELAIKQAEYFRTIGINAFVLESKMPNNRKKICYGSYATKEEAQKDLPKVRSEINVEAYIYP